MDSGEWGKDWFGSSSSERKPLLSSSGNHIRRPFDPNSNDYVFCGLHIRKIALIICFWELVASLVTFIISCSIFTDDMSTTKTPVNPTTPSIGLTILTTTTQAPLEGEVDHFMHATRIFTVSLATVVIGLPSLIMAMYGIRKAKQKWLLPHMAVQLVAILVAIAFFLLSSYEASQYSSNAHEWASEGNLAKRDQQYHMMTYHIELAVFLAIVISTEAVFFLLSRRCFVFFKTKRLVEEGLLLPQQVATLKKEFHDTYTF